MIFSRFIKDQRGVASIEAAICLPLVLMVFFGCFQYAMFFMNASEVNRKFDFIAREAALIVDADKADIMNLIEDELGEKWEDKLTYDVELESKYGEDFAKITMTYTYKISGPFIDRINLNKSYQNFVLLPDHET